MPSRAEAMAVAVTRTTDSPSWTSAAPPACFAMRPVSTVSGRPWKSIWTRWYPGCDMLHSSAVIRPHRWISRRARRRRNEEGGSLLADPQPLDEALVTLEIAPLQVVEKPAPLPHELQQATTGVVVLAMHLEVLGQVHDAIAEERDLHLGRTGVGPVLAVCLHDLRCAPLDACHPVPFVLVRLSV